MKKVLFGFIILLFTFALTGCFDEVEPKEFSEAGMSITLTDEFVQSEYVMAELYIVSKMHIFMGNGENKQIFVDQGYGELTLEEYAYLVLNFANKDVEVKEYSDNDTSFKYAYYESTVEGKVYSYMLVCMEGQSKFYTMNFGCLKKNFTDEVRDQYFGWAKTIRVD